MSLTRLLVVVALVVLVGLTAPAIGASDIGDFAGSEPAADGESPSTAQANESSNESAEDVEPGASLAGALGSEQETLEGELQSREYASRLESADTPEERAAVLEDIANELDTRLQRAESTAEMPESDHPGERAYRSATVIVESRVLSEEIETSARVAQQLGDAGGPALQNRFADLENRSRGLNETVENRTSSVPVNVTDIADDIGVTPPGENESRQTILIDGEEYEVPEGTDVPADFEVPEDFEVPDEYDLPEDIDEVIDEFDFNESDFDDEFNESDFDDDFNESDFDDEFNESDFDDDFNESDFDDEFNESDFDDDFNESDFDDDFNESDFDDDFNESDFDDEFNESDFDDEFNESDFDDDFNETDDEEDNDSDSDDEISSTERDSTREETGNSGAVTQFHRGRTATG